MRKNQPEIKETVGMSIAASIFSVSKKYNLDWKLVSAISMQESAYNIGACRNKTGRSNCSDYGLAQIHYKNVKSMDLNKDKLLTNSAYNLDVAGKILKNFHNRFGKKRTWWVHYHAGNEISEKEMVYKKMVMRYY